MFKRHRNSPDSSPDSKDSSESSLRTAVADSAWAAQDRVVTGVGRSSRSALAVVKWPLERLAWALQRGVIWPIQDRFSHTDGPGQRLAFAAVLVVAAVVGVAALVWAAPNRPDPATSPVAATSPPLADAPVPAVSAAPATATLHGATPNFKPAAAGDSSKVGAAKPIESSAPSSPSATAAAGGETISSAPSSPDSGAEASTVSGAPAGADAVAVARKFAGAFVLYETGNDEASVRNAFGATATPELSRSLLRRPPRLPANVKVPRAKVVNVVAGPSHEGVYTVSVSLLRVGLTSELRLDMEQLKGQRWRVTNVLG